MHNLWTLMVLGMYIWDLFRDEYFQDCLELARMTKINMFPELFHTEPCWISFIVPFSAWKIFPETEALVSHYSVLVPLIVHKSIFLPHAFLFIGFSPRMIAEVAEPVPRAMFASRSARYCEQTCRPWRDLCITVGLTSRPATTIMANVDVWYRTEGKSLTTRCYIPPILLSIPVVKRFSFYPIPNINIGHDSCSQSRCQTHSYTQGSPLAAGLLTVPGAAWSKHSSWYIQALRPRLSFGVRTQWREMHVAGKSICVQSMVPVLNSDWPRLPFREKFSGGKWYYDADSTWFRMKQLWEHIVLCHSRKF